MRPIIVLAAALSAAVLAGCPKRSSVEVRALKQEVSTLRGRLLRVRASQRREVDGLRQRVARLEQALAHLKRQRRIVSPRPAAPREPSPRVATCQGEAPRQVSRIRKGWRLARVRKLLRGIAVQEKRALTLTGAGTTTRLVLKGPCFEVHVARGRVTGVIIESRSILRVRGGPSYSGRSSRRRPRRRRRRRRR